MAAWDNLQSRQAASSGSSVAAALSVAPASGSILVSGVSTWGNFSGLAPSAGWTLAYRSNSGTLTFGVAWRVADGSPNDTCAWGPVDGGDWWIGEYEAPSGELDGPVVESIAVASRSVLEFSEVSAVDGLVVGFAGIHGWDWQGSENPAWAAPLTNHSYLSNNAGLRAAYAVLSGGVPVAPVFAVGPGASGGPGGGAVVVFSTAQPPGPIAITGAATDITASAARLNGVVNPNGDTTAYWFEYGETTSYGSSIPVGEDGDAGSGAAAIPVTAFLPSLDPETTYHYRLVAKNSAGTDEGDDDDFTTTATPVPADDVGGMMLMGVG